MTQPDRTETQGNFDLVDAFRLPGCPICTLALGAVSQYMSSTNYDALGDPDIRRQFEQSQGFCNHHAHQWLGEAFVLGTAQMYRDVIATLAADLEQRSFQGGGKLGRAGFMMGRRAGADGSMMEPSRSCPACEILAETESRLTRTLLKGLSDASFRDAWSASGGLCIPHLRTALAAAPNRDAFDHLRDQTLRHQRVLLAHLEETIRKHDYRFRHEPAGEEKGSPERAVSHVAGSAGIIKPRIV
jgi:hypothetical protein